MSRCVDGFEKWRSTRPINVAMVETILGSSNAVDCLVFNEDITALPVSSEEVSD